MTWPTRPSTTCFTPWPTPPAATSSAAASERAVGVAAGRGLPDELRRGAEARHGAGAGRPGTKQRCGREQLVRTDPDAVRRARQALDELRRPGAGGWTGWPTCSRRIPTRRRASRREDKADEPVGCKCLNKACELPVRSGARVATVTPLQPEGWSLHSCSSPVLVEESAEHLTSTQGRLGHPGRDQSTGRGGSGGCSSSAPVGTVGLDRAGDEGAVGGSVHRMLPPALHGGDGEGPML
jgi:hypothetical protein